MKKRNEECIKPWLENRVYWQYKGRPVLLLGGSKTDHIFLLDDLFDHLVEIKSAGANYVRNTMSQREDKTLKPHKLLSDGSFDLDQWNEEYWIRFHNMLEWTYERDIIVQIEVWDRFDFSQQFWQHSPWNPANNTNYSSEETALAVDYPEHPFYDKQPFFHTIPGMEGYQQQYDKVRAYQNRFVLKMLSYSLQYGNVLYCMNNETSTPHAWGEYWMDLIQKEADKQGVEVYLTDMFDDVHKGEQSYEFRYALDNSEKYSFIDISQINIKNFGEAHWMKLQWIMNEVKSHPRPLNITKIYSDGYFSYGTGGPKDGVEHFFRILLSGCASARFHRPTAGIGLNYIAKAALAAARKMESLVKLWEVTPAMELLSGWKNGVRSIWDVGPESKSIRTYNQAYLAAKPGEKYILYFTYGGCVELNMTGYPVEYTIQWIDVNNGEWGARGEVHGGKGVILEAPDAGGWIAVVYRSQ